MLCTSDVILFGNRIFKFKWSHCGWAPICIKRGKFGCRDRSAQKEDDIKPHRKKNGHVIGALYLQAKECQRCQGTPEARWDQEGSSPRAFWESLVLMTPWSQTSSFQNCEAINFCCFKAPVLFCFVFTLYESPRKLLHIVLKRKRCLYFWGKRNKDLLI